MKFTALLVAAASAIAAQARALDVWAPPFTFPTAGVVLVCGQEYTFTWDVSSPPPEITNPNAQIYLRQNGQTLPTPLVSDVPLIQGSAQVTIPVVDDGVYEAVLFGDSGNFSPDFYITNDSDS